MGSISLPASIRKEALASRPHSTGEACVREASDEAGEPMQADTGTDEMQGRDFGLRGARVIRGQTA